ncbi:MAG: hypothetical protein NWR83_03025 [Salibacteraceae bacterium]|jgi:hypothetical protein|nr:hypothetical protein [Salibacteraceae bacterium]
MEFKLKDLEEKVRLGLELTHKRLIAFKIQKNSPLVIYKEGKIIEIPASELVKEAD